MADSLLNEWGIAQPDRFNIASVTDSITGPMVCYGPDGVVIAGVFKAAEGSPSKDLEEAPGITVKDNEGERIVIASLGLNSGVPTFLLRRREFIPLMEQILRRESNGREMTVCRITADDGLFISYRIPPLPEPLLRVALAKVADGGIATGFAAFCTFLGFLITRCVGFSIPWQGICLSVVAAAIGLFFGGLAQWIGRHYYLRPIEPSDVAATGS
ncbi:MAG: hypothetical protein LBI34_04040 [Puniceicoccales bacterium]|nr:hypothetical protein [Puniceicoccales bacterium]